MQFYFEIHFNMIFHGTSTMECQYSRDHRWNHWFILDSAIVFLFYLHLSWIIFNWFSQIPGIVPRHCLIQQPQSWGASPNSGIYHFIYLNALLIFLWKSSGNHILAKCITPCKEMMERTSVLIVFSSQDSISTLYQMIILNFCFSPIFRH